MPQLFIWFSQMIAMSNAYQKSWSFETRFSSNCDLVCAILKSKYERMLPKTITNKFVKTLRNTSLTKLSDQIFLTLRMAT